MTTAVWLGIDVGTTTVKALAMDEAGRALSIGTADSAWVQTPRGNEADPQGFLARVVEAIGGALSAASSAGPVQVLGIGFAGLAESGVLLEPDGGVSMPVVPWYDGRGGDLVKGLEASLQGEFTRRTGLFLDAQASLAKLLWWQHQDGVRPGSTWLNIPEWLAHELGGERCAEPSLASRTGFFDIDAVREWDGVLSAAGLPSGLVPPVVRAGTATGTVAAGTAARLGLPELAGAALTVVGHDHTVCALGVGCTGTDDLFNSTGTSDVLVRSVAAGSTSDEQRGELASQGVEVSCHVLEGRQILIAGVRAGLTLRRILDLLDAHEPARRDQLDRAAAALDGVAPGLRVEGVSNHVDEVMIHLRDGSSPAQLWLTAAGAAAEETRRLLSSIEAVIGRHGRAVAAGGWSRSSTVRRAKRGVLPGIRFSRIDQPGATGAALVARYASLRPALSLAEFLDSVELPANTDSDEE